MQDRVEALDTAVDDAVGHGLSPECAKMLRDIVFARTLTYSVGRCWATRLYARSLWPCGFRQVQRPRGRSRLLLLPCTCLALRTAGETCCLVG